MLVENSAQIDERLGWMRGLRCIEFAIATHHAPLLRALLSCPEMMQPESKELLEDAIAALYNMPRGERGWLALLAAQGLEVVPYMRDMIEWLTGGAWTEVKVTEWWCVPHSMHAVDLCGALIIAHHVSWLQDI
jgi:hypothetical protein